MQIGKSDMMATQHYSVRSFYAEKLAAEIGVRAETTPKLRAKKSLQRVGARIQAVEFSHFATPDVRFPKETS
jgi:hypothetical protein